MAQKHIRFDWAMKRLLRNKANFEVLEGFLSELLDDDFIIQEILESESNQNTQDDKFNRVDILVKNQADELALIEVQNDSEHDYFHRMNYGQAKLLTEQLDLGESYANIKKIYSINIVYFDLGQGKDYIYVGKTDFKGLHQKEDILQLSTKQKELYAIEEIADIYTTYYVLKVNNFDNIAKNALDEWIYFLKNSEIKDEFKAKGLEKAKEVLRVADLEPAEKEAFDIYIKDWRIRSAEITTAKFDGRKEVEEELKPIIQQQKEELEQKEQLIENSKQELEQKEQLIEDSKQELEQKEQLIEAKEEVIEQTKQELEQKEQQILNLAKMLKQNHVPIEQIQKATGLSKEEIENL